MKQSEAAQTSRPERPYKRWDYFETKDHSIFFGRTLETRLLFSEILSSRLVLLYAKSGTGKTSLINAGVRPMLEEYNFRTFIIRMGDDPFEAIKSATASLNAKVYADARRESLSGYFKRMLSERKDSIVLFLDQFEEFFIHLTDDVQQNFVSQIADLYREKDLPIFLVFSLREDFFVEMDCFRAHIPSIFENNSNLRLRWFNEAAAREAIEEPAKIFNCAFSEALVKTLLEELRRDGKGIEPIRLQLVCDALWDATGKGEREVIRLEDYKNLGGVREIEETAFNDVLEEVIEDGDDSETLLPLLLRALITEAGTKNYVEHSALLEQLKVAPQALDEMIRLLQEKRLIRASRKEKETFYELSHDYLVSQVKRWLARRGINPTEAQSMLAELVSNWKKTREPIDVDDFNFIDRQRTLLEFDEDEIEMLAQAAIKHSQSVKFWLDRLGSEIKALELIKKLYGSGHGNKSFLIPPLGLLRSAEATRMMVRFTVEQSPMWWSMSKEGIDELVKRPDFSALHELYTIARSDNEPEDLRRAAIKYLAIIRAFGNKFPPGWTRQDIYTMMARFDDQYNEYDVDTFGGPPKLLGNALVIYEDAQGRAGRLRAWAELLLVAFLVGLYKGLFGALLGAIGGALVGFLYALFINLWQLLQDYGAYGGWRHLFSGYWTPFSQGATFGVVLGWVVGFGIFAGQIIVRGRRAMKRLLQETGGEKNTS